MNSLGILFRQVCFPEGMLLQSQQIHDQRHHLTAENMVIEIMSSIKEAHLHGTVMTTKF